jgi:hypothetical protein
VVLGFSRVVFFFRDAYRRPAVSPLFKNTPAWMWCCHPQKEKKHAPIASFGVRGWRCLPLNMVDKGLETLRCRWGCVPQAAIPVLKRFPLHIAMVLPLAREVWGGPKSGPAGRGYPDPPPPSFVPKLLCPWRSRPPTTFGTPTRSAAPARSPPPSLAVPAGPWLSC